MPENIQQHYVPKSILKSFTFNGKRVYFLRKTEVDMPIRSENVESICKENGYYRFDIKKEDKSIKRIDYDKEVFQQIDNDIAPVIRKIIEDGTITNLQVEEKKTLVRYTAYQYVRVPAIRNIANSILNDEQEARRIHAEALRNNEFVVSTFEDILMNLKLDTIKPIVGDEFIISDTAVLQDPTGEGIYFPISPDICLIYYHPNYDITNCLDSICINELQFLASTQFVIAKSELVLDKIKKEQHKNHIDQILKNSENNSYWKCVLKKKNPKLCLVEQNRNNILKPLKKEYDKAQFYYFLGFD